MKSTDIYLFFYVFLTTIVLTSALDPITATAVVGLGASLGRTLWNYFHESCSSKWINYNATGDCAHIQRVQVFYCAYS